MPAINTLRPTFTIKDAIRIAQDLYNLTVAASELPSYSDQNFHLTTSTGDQFTLKFSNAAEQREALDLQHSAMRHIAQQDATLRCPQVQSTRNGETITPVLSEAEVAVSSPANTQHLVTLLTYLPGNLFVHIRPQTQELLGSLGSFMGRLDKALANFTHPAAPSKREWDLKNAPNMIRKGLPFIFNPTLYKIITGFVQTFQTWVEPRLPELRTSIIHNDANDYNVLAEGETVTGIIDFGDMACTQTIFELAVTCAYAILGKTDPITAVSPIIAGYHSQYPLTDLELELLYTLICMRLCTSVANSANMQQKEPDNAYLSVTAKPGKEALTKLAHIDPNFAHYAFRHACGLPPFPKTNLVVNGNVYTQLGEPTATSFINSGLSKDAILDSRQAHLGPSLSISYKKPLKIVRGWMQYLYDEQGNRYLDGVNNVPHVGHCHPHVVETAVSQTALLNTNTRYLHDNIVQYAERLLATFPDPLSVVFFVCSGSEANELALRMARTHTGRHDLLVLDAAYHGNTGNLIDISPYKHNGKGGKGTPPHVHVLPLPDGYRGPHKGSGLETGKKYAAAVQETLNSLTENGSKIAGFIAESILSCGGQIVLPDGYLTDAYQYVRAAGGVCIADEVQVGFGRVGSHFWAFETQGVVPDIVTLGKPMGNGHPIAAVVTTPEIAASFNNGMEYFNTFGGNPVSCAVGTAVLDVIERENLQENAHVVGNYLMSGLRNLMSDHPIIGDVRGLGLFVGIELVRDHDSLEPADVEAGIIVEKMKERGILLSTDGPLHNVIKIKPPIVFSKENADFLVNTLEEILTEGI